MRSTCMAPSQKLLIGVANYIHRSRHSALQNNNGVPVSFVAVANPADVDSWNTVLTLADGRTDCYGLVPCTCNQEVWSNFAGFVNDQSTPQNGLWRELWLSLQPITIQGIVTSADSTDGNVVLATISEDPDNPGNYTIVNATSGNGQFVTNGVAPGDVFRFFFTSDGFGNTTWTEYTVTDVLNQDSVRLVAGPASPVSTPQKMEIWRNLDTDQQIAALSAQNTFANRRIMLVWPGTCSADGFTDVPGFALTAALAALASGVVPQQSLTNVAITGFTAVPLTSQFTRDQLAELAGSGIWIVAQNQSGNIYTLDALTTGPYSDINQRSECITRNLDNLSIFQQQWFAPYIGVSNVTPGLLNTLNAEFNAMATAAMSRNFVSRLGAQVIDITLTDLRQDAVLLDTVLMTQAVTLPYALDVLQCYLVL